MSDAQIEQIYRKTDGWAAGLIMAMQVARAGNISDAFMEKLAGENLFDYFTTEIFQRLDQSVRSFLLSTAFLPEVTAQTAERLTAYGNADHILSDLRRKNFFIANRGTPYLIIP